MKRTLSFVLLLGVVSALILPVSGSSAQSDGVARCEAARAAANDGATRFRGTPIVFGAGGSGDQIVLGTDGPDVLSGGSGNDTLCGFGGDDELYGGSGADILVGGEGVDALFGETGNDTLFAAEGEIASGGTGNNRLITVTEGPDTRTASITFEVDEGTTCRVPIRLSGFTPNSEISLDTFVSPNANGAGAVLNNNFFLQIGGDGTVEFNDFSNGAPLVNGAYLQLRTGSFASPWTLIDCAPPPP